ncbi:hypothetical protein HMPREF0294_0214 [Corynebacterium glucuronolyticum ATCC 51867]|nr:hypothetical protein HMPREF0294_0214 [Corynebacterium glucuronolyticum ATCC 51867]
MLPRSMRPTIPSITATITTGMMMRMRGCGVGALLGGTGSGRSSPVGHGGGSTRSPSSPRAGSGRIDAAMVPTIPLQNNSPLHLDHSTYPRRLLAFSGALLRWLAGTRCPVARQCSTACFPCPGEAVFSPPCLLIRALAQLCCRAPQTRPLPVSFTGYPAVRTGH